MEKAIRNKKCIATQKVKGRTESKELEMKIKKNEKKDRKGEQRQKEGQKMVTLRIIIFSSYVTVLFHCSSFFYLFWLL